MFNSITIVGVGLISGSFSLALKEKRLTKKEGDNHLATRIEREREFKMAIERKED